MHLCSLQTSQFSAYSDLLVGNANAILLLLSALLASGLSPEHRGDVVAGQYADFARSER